MRSIRGRRCSSSARGGDKASEPAFDLGRPPRKDLVLGHASPAAPPQDLEHGYSGDQVDAQARTLEKQGFTPEAALNVGTQIHTSPAQFGKVMAETKPRLAVAYHFFNDFDTSPAVLREVRRTYEGELALATDYMVFNVTKDDINVRMAAIEEAIWPQPSNIPLVPPDPSIRRTELSKKMLEGRVIHQDVLQEVYDDINKRFGSNEKVPE